MSSGAAREVARFARALGVGAAATLTQAYAQLTNCGAKKKPSVGSAQSQLVLPKAQPAAQLVLPKAPPAAQQLGLAQPPGQPFRRDAGFAPHLQPEAPRGAECNICMKATSDCECPHKFKQLWGLSEYTVRFASF